MELNNNMYNFYLRKRCNLNWYKLIDNIGNLLLNCYIMVIEWEKLVDIHYVVYRLLYIPYIREWRETKVPKGGHSFNPEQSFILNFQICQKRIIVDYILILRLL